MRRLLCAFALGLAATAVGAQEPDAGGRYLAVVETDVDAAGATPDESTPGAALALALLDETGMRLWSLSGPFATLDQAADARTGDTAPVAAEIVAGDESLARGDDAEAAHYRLQRLRFHDGAEARGLEIVRDRLVPAMTQAGGDPLLLRLTEGDWDAFVIDGPFAAAEEAQARIERRDVAFENALVAHIGDPRTVAATRAELDLLVAETDERVVRRVDAAD